MNTLIQKSKKIVLFGDGGVGKTSYINRLRTSNFTREYIPTIGIKVNHLDYWENNLNDIFNIWDFSGQEKYSEFIEEYCKGAIGAIIMFDVSSKTSFKNVIFWITKIKMANPIIPIIICGNKCDIKERNINLNDVIKKYDYIYFDISVKCCYNIEKPIQYIREIYENVEFSLK
jgi:GTP-binding nuclear protein Ran